jgi:hypothetical protein
MIASTDHNHLAHDNTLPLPTYRFGILESPLKTLAASAGFASFADLAAHVRTGATVIASAPEICGRSIGNALLIRDACQQFGLCVVEVVWSGQDERLVLAPDV